MSARMITVDEIIPGNILADTVISISGKILLGKDVALTPKHISLLKVWDVQNVFIHIEEEEEPSAESVGKPLSESTESEDYLRFAQEYDSIVTATVQSFDFIKRRSIIPIPLLKNTASNIHSSLINNSSLMNYLLVMDFKLADFISRHSVMVAFFAGIIARQMKWSEQDIKDVALAGLLHDLGSIIVKGEYSHNHAHLPEAATLLKDIKDITNNVLLGIIQHRECIDGSGFPTGVNGLKIHPFAKIIAVADIFHAHTYNSEYANPFPVLDSLANEMFGKLDPSACHSFINRARDSLMHNKILLSTGQEAEIIYFHPTSSSLPVVKTADNQIIDLSQSRGLTIRRIIPPSYGM